MLRDDPNCLYFDLLKCNFCCSMKRLPVDMDILFNSNKLNTTTLGIITDKLEGQWFQFVFRKNKTCRLSSCVSANRSLDCLHNESIANVLYHTNKSRPSSDHVLVFAKYFVPPKTMSYLGSFWIQANIINPFSEIESYIRNTFTVSRRDPLYYCEDVRYDIPRLDALQNDLPLNRQDIRFGDIIIASYSANFIPLIKQAAKN